MEIIGVPHHRELTNIVENSPLAVLSSFNKFIKRQHLREVIPDLDPQAEDLLEKIFKFDPSERPTIIQILNHPYLQRAGESIFLKEELFSDEGQDSEKKSSIEVYK